MTAREQLERSLDRATERLRNARSDEDERYYTQLAESLRQQIERLPDTQQATP
jgi:hypothetical protein